MRTLQGSSTLALDAQGLRISFSKNPMGVPGKASLPLASLSYSAAVHYDNPACFGKRPRDGSNEWFSDPSKRLAAAYQPSYPVVSPYAFYPAAYFAGGAIDSGVMGNSYTSSMLSPQFSMPYTAPWQTACHPPSNAFPAGIDATSSASVPIDTLMIANLSLGTNEGDVQTVMYGFAGYKRSKLVNNGKSCTAWVQFEDIPCAEAAMRTLQGSSTLALDAQGLRIVFSKKPMGVSDSAASSLSASTGPAAAGSRAVPPIDTLMVSNISLQASESDLRGTVSGFAGYKRSKLLNNGKSCTAWVQFEDIPCAEAAMRTLQGSSTLALDAQGLRIAFSKNPMGVTSSRASS